MFSDASSVLIGEKEVESIRLGSTVLYEKPSSVTDVNISIIWTDAGYENERPSRVPITLVVFTENGPNTIDDYITSTEGWQKTIENIPTNADLQLTAELSKYDLRYVLTNKSNYTITATRIVVPTPPPVIDDEDDENLF